MAARRRNDRSATPHNTMTPGTVSSVLRFGLLAIIAFCLPATSSAQDASAPEAARAPKEVRGAVDRQHVVILQPVVLCDDDGSHAAPFALPKQWVDRVYTKADLEFLYLPPRRWSYGDARQGKVNLDVIVAAGQANGMISRDPRIVTLLFVSSVDGQAGPLGRGLQNGNICFVCLGPTPDANDPMMEAFVVAHEVGHCLNLRHTVDDPRVPDEAFNLQGGGPFEERLAVGGLHESQRDTVMESPLVNARLRFYTSAESARRLLDETWGPYVTGAHPDQLRFVLSLAPDAEIPLGTEARLAFAREKHAGYAAEFTDQEKKVLRGRVADLQSLMGAEWPLLARLPWNFVKVRDGFCRGFPHTRGLSIVLGPRALARIEKDPAFALTVLLHEKLHVAQRLAPHAFASLYSDYGYQRVEIDPGASAGMNLVQNPDALSSTWAIEVDEILYWLATTMIKRGGRLILHEELRPLEPGANGLFAPGPAVPLARLGAFRERFAIRSGHDHPNEVAAYLAEQILRMDFLGQQVEVLPAAEKDLDATRSAFRALLGGVGAR